MQRRPCFLVVDREYSGSISSRKLVIETAKLNVITAYSGEEAISTLRRFPAIDAAVLDAGIADIPCDELVGQLRAIQPKLCIIAVGRSNQEGKCGGEDHFLASFDPARLLELLKEIHPRLTAEIDAAESSSAPA